MTCWKCWTTSTMAAQKVQTELAVIRSCIGSMVCYTAHLTTACPIKADLALWAGCDDPAQTCHHESILGFEPEHLLHTHTSAPMCLYPVAVGLHLCWLLSARQLKNSCHRLHHVCKHFAHCKAAHLACNCSSIPRLAIQPELVCGIKGTMLE